MEKAHLHNKCFPGHVFLIKPLAHACELVQVIHHFMRMEENVQMDFSNEEPAEEEKCNEAPFSATFVRVLLGSQELPNYLSKLDGHT